MDELRALRQKTEEETKRLYQVIAEKVKSAGKATESAEKATENAESATENAASSSSASPSSKTSPSAKQTGASKDETASDSSSLPDFDEIDAQEAMKKDADKEQTEKDDEKSEKDDEKQTEIAPTAATKRKSDYEEKEKAEKEAKDKAEAQMKKDFVEELKGTTFGLAKERPCWDDVSDGSEKESDKDEQDAKEGSEKESEVGEHGRPGMYIAHVCKDEGKEAVEEAVKRKESRFKI